MSTNLLTAESAPFRAKLHVRVHPHDLAAIDAARGTSLERADWLRWALRDALKRAGVPPYGEVHTVEAACPVCREPAALTCWVAWDAGSPREGILAGWHGETQLWTPQVSSENANPTCGCTLSESDVLSACERAAEQFEARLLSSEARENAGAKP